MGQSSDAAGQDASPSSPDAESSNTSSRGLFGRLLTAFSATSDQDESDDHAQGDRPTTPTPGLLNLRRMRVEDVAIPKADIVAVPVSSSQDELLAVFKSSGLTRIPVFNGTLDTPVGLANLKDFALLHGFNDNGGEFDLTKMLRPLMYVPPSMPLGVLLQKMQTERIHMALVIDEYGGTDGLVTIEDLIEQVVGEIEDEHDVDEVVTFAEEKTGVWLALAKTQLDEFESEIGIDLREHDEIDKEEVDTLGGLVAMLAGQVPARGEVISHPDGPEFEIIDADPRRIKRVRVRLTPPPKTEG